jgi:rod shape-determining protein MreC
MPYGSLDRTPPPFFKQGPTSLSKLLLLSALALFLMVTDKRFEFGKILRASLATALNPVVNTVLQPVAAVQDSFKYLDTIKRVKSSEQEAHKKLLLLSQRANQVETLALENLRLRQLLSLKETLSTPAQAAEVLYDATDPYSRKIIVNRGSVHAVQLGSPVIDELGVLGQVVRVFPLTSEVAMIIDREQTTPVLNTRTGVRSVAYGNPSANGDVLELRFISGNADVLAGDVLTTSGVDGVYPAGLLVAKIEKVERRADSGFAKIICTPKANVLGAKHVMILNPLSTADTPRPAGSITTAPIKRGAKK